MGPNSSLDVPRGQITDDGENDSEAEVLITFPMSRIWHSVIYLTRFSSEQKVSRVIWKLPIPQGSMQLQVLLGADLSALSWGVAVGAV